MTMPMAQKEAWPEDVVLTRLLRLNAVFTGLVTGILAGLGVFGATNWLILKGGPVVGPHLALLGQFFIGYRVTFVGSLIGFGYALVCGFVMGFAVAWIHNRVVTYREARTAARGRANG
jgi:hypothetical protein